MEVTAIGVDNGIAGAAFALWRDGSSLKWSYVRFKKVKGKYANANMIDYSVIMDWLMELTLRRKGSEFRIAIEKPAAGKRGKTTAQAIASTAMSLGRTMVPFEECGLASSVIVCPAVTWQKHWWPASQKSDGKPSIGIAQRKFGWDFIPKGCKVPQDGITDASLMADLALRDDKWASLRKDVETQEKARKKPKKPKKPPLPNPLPKID